MRVLVCGGRDFHDQDFVNRVLDRLLAKSGTLFIITGGAKGADTCGKFWAISRKQESAHYPADWKRDGKAAGPIRNQWMLDNTNPNLIVAFPGGTGTDHMVRIATAAGAKVLDFRKHYK